MSRNYNEKTSYTDVTQDLAKVRASPQNYLDTDWNSFYIRTFEYAGKALVLVRAFDIWLPRLNPVIDQVIVL